MNKTILFLIALICHICLIPRAEAEEIDIQAIIQIESSGNPNAYNNGCIGLMGITPKGALADYTAMRNEMWGEGNWIPYRAEDLYRPYVNVKIGTWYINTRIPQMFKAYGIEDTVEYRLIAFNWGLQRLREHLKGKPLPKSVRAYIAKYRRLTQ